MHRRFKQNLGGSWKVEGISWLHNWRMDVTVMFNTQDPEEAFNGNYATKYTINTQKRRNGIFPNKFVVQGHFTFQRSTNSYPQIYAVLPA